MYVLKYLLNGASSLICDPISRKIKVLRVYCPQLKYENDLKVHIPLQARGWIWCF